MSPKDMPRRKPQHARPTAVVVYTTSTPKPKAA